ncbi:class I SAM-dependent methyltransferase [Hymenobacter cellulosilyticus]|uniref:Class I SAM-dependent methyltransferase n=1 Tax=Hymenobacter cellulosilyticus TaxID=2932248 RepID=A0A8T9QAU3_9BACT|nr:class I SAM-dependent methyltransferase [Hymenobacter cellulosilyticus]UOQ71993.1 class I SAM-dependent methyltransferase [Hymenobacter cellulosilyticus]
MNIEYELKYHQIEENYWWFQARRDMVFRLVQDLKLPKSAAILEIGCSGGPLMQRLAATGYTDLTGIDVSAAGIAVAQQRGIPNVSCMDGAHLDFPDNAFDLVIASDVLEHIQDEAQALREWMRVLRPGGQILIFVPAFSFLWGKHDVVNQHFRRYSAAQLTASIRGAGLLVKRSSYWNVGLFFPTAAVRLLNRWQPKPEASTEPLKDDFFATPPLLNTLLRGFITAENRLLQLVNAPVGVSVFALARKPQAA